MHSHQAKFDLSSECLVAGKVINGHHGNIGIMLG